MAFVIADPGADHLGRLDRMLRLFDAAKSAGADAIKPQLYRADSLYDEVCSAERAAVSEYEMPLVWVPVLKEYADSIGIEFMCSCFSPSLYDAVDPYVLRHKIASLEAGDLELVRKVIGYGKPTIISTGAMNVTELIELSDEAPEATLLQCATQYPADIDTADLALIGGLLTGYSDHTTSIIAGAVAVARGATVVEKHITLGDPWSERQPDYGHSLAPTDFATYVDNIREAERLMGVRAKRVRDGELRHLRRKIGKLRGAA